MRRDSCPPSSPPASLLLLLSNTIHQPIHPHQHHVFSAQERPKDNEKHVSRLHRITLSLVQCWMSPPPQTHWSSGNWLCGESLIWEPRQLTPPKKFPRDAPSFGGDAPSDVCEGRSGGDKSHPNRLVAHQRVEAKRFSPTNSNWNSPKYSDDGKSLITMGARKRVTRT